MEDNFDPEQYELEFVDIHAQCAQKDYATIYEETKQLLLDSDYDDCDPEVKGRAEVLAKRLQEDHTLDTLFLRIGEKGHRSVDLHLDALILRELGNRVDREASRTVAESLWTESEAETLRRFGFERPPDYERGWEFGGDLQGAFLAVNRDTADDLPRLYISGINIAPIFVDALEEIPALVLSRSRSCVFTYEFSRVLPSLRTFLKHVGLWEQAQQEFRDAFAEGLLTEI